MTQVAMAHTFVQALAKLDPANTKRTVGFLEKLLNDPALGSGVHSEIIRDARNRSIHSLRISPDLRAIARQAGDQLLLLFVGHHDDSYEWVRAHCFGCDLPTAGRQISIEDVPSASTPDFMTCEPGSAWFCTLADNSQLSRALERVGIDGGLVH